MRALAQSLGREFGPKGVHVSHAVIDGVIDVPATKDWTFEAPDAKISADAVSSLFPFLKISFFSFSPPNLWRQYNGLVGREERRGQVCRHRTNKYADHITHSIDRRRVLAHPHAATHGVYK